MIWTVFNTTMLYALRNRMWLLFTLLSPLVFFTIYLAMSPAGLSGGTSKLPVFILDEDRSDLSKALVQSMRGDQSLVVTTEEENQPQSISAIERAENAVRSGAHPLALVIAKGFQESFQVTRSIDAKLQVFSGNVYPGAAMLLWGTLQHHAIAVVPGALLSWGDRYLQYWLGDLHPQQQESLQKKIAEFSSGDVDPAKVQTELNSVVTVDSHDVAQSANAGNPLIAFYAAALGVMCMLFSSCRAGGTVLEEKEMGTLDRILTSGASIDHLLVGKLLYAVAMGCLQFILLFFWVSILFNLQVLHHLGGFLVMMIITSICSAAFGLMLSLACRNRVQQGMISLGVVTIFAFLGGTLFPRIFMPALLQKIGLVTFNAWALDGFTKVFSNSVTLFALWPQVLALVLFTLAFFAVARYFAQRLVFA